MKILLSLFSVASLSVSTLTSGINVLIDDAKNATNFKTVDANDLANKSQYVAESLINKQLHSLDSKDYLSYELQNNSDIASGLNDVFGDDNPTDLATFVDSSSQIQDTDAKDPGKLLAPDSIKGIKLLLDEFNNSETAKDPSKIFSILYALQIPKILGQILPSILGQNNPLLSIFMNMPIDAILKALNNLNENIVGKEEYFETVENHDNNSILVPTDDVAFSKDLETGLSKAVGDILAQNDLSSDEYDSLANFSVLLVDYISQFDFASGSKVNDNLFDDGKTNEDYHLNLDHEKVQAINTDNLHALINNLANFDSNNGLGLAQLINTIFGSEYNYVGYSDSHRTQEISIKSFSTNIDWIYIAEDERYYDPIMTYLQQIANDNESAIFTKFAPSSSTSAIQGKDILPQLISIMGGMMQYISANQTIDVPINLLYNYAYLPKTGLGQFLDAIFKVFDSISPELKPSLSDFVTMVKDMQDNKGWMSETFSPGANSKPWHIFTVDFNELPEIEDVVKPGTTWDDLWNGKLTFWSSFKTVMGDVGNITGSKIPLPDQFTGFKSMLDNITVPFLNVSISNLLTSLNSKGGLIDALFTNLSKIEDMYKQIIAIATNSHTINALRGAIKANIDFDKDKTGLIDKLYNASNLNLFSEIEIISIAINQNAFTGHDWDAKKANDEIYNILGYKPENSNKINSDSIYGILSSNWNVVQNLFTSLGVSVDSLTNTLSKDFTAAFAEKWNVSNIKLDNDTNKITYDLENTSLKKSYNVTLVPFNNRFYSIAINS